MKTDQNSSDTKTIHGRDTRDTEQLKATRLKLRAIVHWEKMMKIDQASFDIETIHARDTREHMQHESQF